MAKNFQQNGRPMHQQRPGLRSSGPYKKPFKPRGRPGENHFNQMMFNASQIPDNPGFLDFNNPTPPIGGGPAGPGTGTNMQNTTPQKKKNNKNKQKNKQVQPQQPPQQQPQQQNGGGGSGSNWNKNRNVPQGVGGGVGGLRNRYSGGAQRGFNNVQPGGPNRGRRMIPPMGGLGPRGPMPPIPPLHGFQPMIPPIPPMGRGGPMPPPPPMVQSPHFMRRGRGRGGPMPPMPLIPPMPPMIPSRMPPVPFNGIGKIKKNNKMVKKVVKGKSTIKTLKTLVNQYPIEKPWVTEDIRAEYDKKIDIENRLKGNKDDELFAQFKTQRDKFVAMYESAREEYLKQEAAAVKAKDAKDKQTINKTATKDGNNKEAIPNKNAKA